MNGRLCAACKREYPDTGITQLAQFPDGSSVAVCVPCSRSGALAATVGSMTWAEAKAYKANLAGEGHHVYSSSAASDLKEALLQFFVGLLVAGAGIAFAIGTKGRFVAFGAILLGGIFAVVGFFRSVFLMISIRLRRNRWRPNIVERAS